MFKNKVKALLNDFWSEFVLRGNQYSVPEKFFLDEKFPLALNKALRGMFFAQEKHTCVQSRQNRKIIYFTNPVCDRNPKKTTLISLKKGGYRKTLNKGDLGDLPYETQPCLILQ